MSNLNKPPYDCPACGAKPGNLHKLGCDQERCRGCGGQYFMNMGCCPRKDQRPRLPWSGEMHGFAECREFGYWAAMDDGWKTMRPEPAFIGEGGVYPGVGMLTINAAKGILRWDRHLGRYVKAEETYSLIARAYTALTRSDAEANSEAASHLDEAMRILRRASQ